MFGTNLEMTMRKSVAILWYMKDHFGNMRWELTQKTTWLDYVQYSKSVSGEGTQWKAQMI
jgi:hypothetical protein